MSNNLGVVFQTLGAKELQCLIVLKFIGFATGKKKLKW